MLRYFEEELARKIASGVIMRARFERFEYLVEQARSILQVSSALSTYQGLFFFLFLTFKVSVLF